VSAIGFFLKKIRFRFLSYKERVEYQPTFQKELNYQCSRILPYASSLMAVGWIPYIPVDMKLYPNEPLIIALRIGLSLIGFTVFVLHLTKKFVHCSLLMLTIIGAYFVIATGFITALTKGDSVYIGGYLSVTTMLAVVPLQRRASLSIILCSLSTFMIVGLITGMSFTSVREMYSLNDLISAFVVTSIFVILMDHMRFQGWQNTRKIVEQREELKLDKINIDKLLLNILPVSVAKELKENGFVKPVYYNSATIVFTDFVGFTKISEILTPEELVAELDKLFSIFDHVMDKYSLEKLKTIGDSYMFVGGVPIASNNHAIECVLAAIEIQDQMSRVNDEKDKMGKPIFELRIGVNTGPLMAGVVGEKKFVYDVWGDSVNLASRMESSGERGLVNISKSTYEIVKDFFETEVRGEIFAKNKGVVKMYFAKRLKPEMSLDEKGFVANEKFRDLYLTRVQK
jgi:class 3 adenylate cyclase